jgi:hypothetical protein
MDLDRWHDLLTNRFVCEVCLTRYFTRYRRCRACGSSQSIVPLGNFLSAYARTDQELRDLIARGQYLIDTADAAHHEASAHGAGL